MTRDHGIGAVLVGLVAVCAYGVAAQLAEAQETGIVTAQRDLARAKQALMLASYTGDLEELARLAAELGASDDRVADEWLAHYHAGFAHYVLAMMVGPNGLVLPEGDAARMIEHVDEGIRQLEASLAGNATSADALALLSVLYAMKLRSDPAKLAAELGPKSQALLARALALEPKNPRVVLIDAMATFWKPPRLGGDPEHGLARWLEATELFAHEKQPRESALPSWGHAEAWAWLPSAYLALQPPRSQEAERAARRALEIRPDFRWVKVSLLPRVQAALKR